MAEQLKQLQALKSGSHHIFNINTPADFKVSAIATFNYQAQHNPVYKQFINHLKINPEQITEIEQIPFLPIDFFKTHAVVTSAATIDNADIRLNYKVFLSSGTTGQTQSKHYVKDCSIYEESYLKTMELFYGRPGDYCILALLPSYLEREGSSLIYMMNDLINRSKHPQSGFYLNEYDKLLATLKQLETKKQKTILLGVSFALLDFAEYFTQNSSDALTLQNTIVMETGGMKGKRKELLREELHEILCSRLGVTCIHSEYGMTELLSQAYSKGKGVFHCPPWMKILIRDINDPFAVLQELKSGGINVIDLANIHSCAFIATQDIGKLHADNSFEILGRFDNSDIRGCNLLVG